jgi:hypothetical protein
MRAGMGLDSDAWSSFRLYDGQSQDRRIGLNVRADTQADLSIYDHGGRLRNRKGYTNKNMPFVLLNGDQEKTMAILPRQ